jgi:hypothetical protein
MNKFRLFFAAAVVLTMCSFVYADVILDMEITKIGTTSTGAVAGSGLFHSTTQGPGFVDPIQIRIYAQVTNGSNVSYIANGGTNSLLFWKTGGTLRETSNGVHGNMAYVASTIYASPYNTLLAPDLVTIGGDVALGDVAANPWVARAGSLQEVSTGVADEDGIMHPNPAVSKWVTLGTFTFTPKTGSNGSATINYNQIASAFSYGMGNYENADYHYWTDSTTGGLVAPSGITVEIVPEPSTLILLGMGCLALLAIRRRK